MLVELTFRRAPAEGDADAPAPAGSEEGEDEGTKQQAAAPPANRDTTVMTVQVGARDSIDSLTKRIRVSILRPANLFMSSDINVSICPMLLLSERGIPIKAVGSQARRSGCCSSRSSASR